MKLVRTKDGDTLGLILYRELARDDDEIFELAYAQNIHLYAFLKHASTFPAGVLIALPDLPDKSEPQAVNVWD
ncbi:hypothetical protein ACJZRZ_003186 [Vibrio parahaemolyticus]|nr:hypothetical protein [Vibrio parahaemolyticus]EJE8673469.1 hypothetical protein [Vibrio parahaemolyticus]